MPTAQVGLSGVAPETSTCARAAACQLSSAPAQHQLIESMCIVKYDPATDGHGLLLLAGGTLATLRRGLSLKLPDIMDFSRLPRPEGGV